MRIRELVEAVEDTQDVLLISQYIIDWIYKNGATTPGTVIDVENIPRLQLLLKTPEGATLVDATRVKIVSPSVFKSPNTGGDAAPYYSNSGGYVAGTEPYQDARASKKVRQGKTQLLDPASKGEFSDKIGSRGREGEKLVIRLNVNSINDRERMQRILTHELGHHLTTIKGMDNVADWRKADDAQWAKEKLDQHNQAKRGEKYAKTADGKLLMPPRAPQLLDPKEEKRLIGIIKKAPKQLPNMGNMAYWKDKAEIQARLMEAAEDLAKAVPLMTRHRDKGALNSTKINELVKYVLNKNQITLAFVDFASEAEFQAALRGRLTSTEIKQAYANPEFRQLYNRMYKFLEAEIGPGGFIGQGTDFKSWDQSVPAAKPAANVATQATKAGFIERFKQVVIQGTDVVKNAARMALRYNRMADAALNDLLKKSMPILFSKGLLKSIPVAGAVIGVAFAIPRLVKGDVPGAGIELVSGIGSLLTAIPATAYQAARDLYGEYYTHADTNKPAVLEYDAAQDPPGTEQRVRDLSAKIAEQLKAGIEQNRSILKNLPRTVEPNLGLI